jgi:hypothetical protein
MPRSGEHERSTEEHAVVQPEPAGDISGTDDLTLARLAAAPGEGAEAAAVELTGRHLTAVFAYATQCTATSQAAAFLTTTAIESALLAPQAGGTDTAWRPHVLASVLRTAAQWLWDERRQWLSGELAARLPNLAAPPEPGEPQPPVVTAFNRMPVRFQVGLWHLVVENEGPETVARHLGADANVVRTWIPTVENRFRSALIEVHEELAASACRPFTRILVTASETDPTRAIATRASSGLDEHLATCADCAQSLDDLTRLNGPEGGASLAETLLPWGGRRYRESKTGNDGNIRPASLPAQAPGEGRDRRMSSRVSRYLRSARNQRAVLVPLGVCTAITAVLACVATPQFEATGKHSQSMVPDDVGLLARDGAASALPLPHSTEHHKVRTESQHGKKQGKDKDKGKGKAKGSDKKVGKKDPGPRSDPSPTDTDPSPASLAVAGAALRWDFGMAQPQDMGPYPASFIGGAKLGSGREGSLTCDGSGYLQTHGPVVDTARSFTASAWVRLTSKSGFQTVAGQNGQNVSGFFLQYSDEADRWRLAMDHSDSTDAHESQVLSTGAPPLNQWQHLTAVVDGDAQEIRLYVNGALQGTARDVHRWSAEGPFSVGRGLWGGDAADLWHGGIDDVRVYTRALGPSEVESLATAEPNA